MIYKRAQRPEDLLWHSEKPSPFLVEAIQQRKQPGRALDIGCGAGVFSVYLAKNKYDTTGIDFIPLALQMGRRLAQQKDVTVNFVETDLFEWQTSQPFDIVLDSGCLHTVGDGNLKRYKQQLLSWTTRGSDFIVGHFGKRNFFDWRPVGPHRRTRDEIVKLFAPEFEAVKYDEHIQTGVRLPVGPTIQLMSLWFRRIK